MRRHIACFTSRKLRAWSPRDAGTALAAPLRTMTPKTPTVLVLAPSLDDARALQLADAVARTGEGPATLVEMHDPGAWSIADAPRQVVGALSRTQALAWLAPWSERAATTLFGVEIDPELVAAGVSGCWPLEWLHQPERVAAALAVDRARWEREAGLRASAAQLRDQLDERRWVERAKGVLMEARGVGEDEAFRMLRGASMHANLRLGAVARAVTEAAHWADAVNRAGQLRMLSQWLVRLTAQRLAGVAAREAQGQGRLVAARARDNLAQIGMLRAAQAGAPAAVDAALDAARQAWDALERGAGQRPAVEMLADLDARGEVMLAAAEVLTSSLEAAGARAGLRLVNLCGRQRMRAQRLAKAALLALALRDPGRAAAVAGLEADFEAALLELDRLPLSNAEIQALRVQAREQWGCLLRGMRDGDAASMVGSCDALTEVFDHMTTAYEQSLQVIMS
jgi:hypothetical protein